MAKMISIRRYSGISRKQGNGKKLIFTKYLLANEKSMNRNKIKKKKGLKEY